MDALEIVKLKDRILEDLTKRPGKRETVEATYINLKIEGISKDVVKGYVQEMVNEGVLKTTNLTGNKTVMFLQPLGEKLLFEGGYTKLLENELKNKELQECDNQKFRLKTRLEIENLKRTKWFSIAAIIISIVALLVSIFKE